MLQATRVLFLAFLVTVLFSQTLQAQADYVCLPNDNYQDSPFWRANLVFTGLAEKVSVENNQYVVTFAVEKSYRGVNEKSVEITSNFNFKEGEHYFVYASFGKDGKSYKLDDGMCGTPPILLKDAKDDIEYAEDIVSGKIGTRIYGFVYQDKQDSIKTSRQNVPLAQIEVKIKSKKILL